MTDESGTLVEAGLSPDERGALSAWMDAQGLAPGPLERMRPITGGTQNRMVRFDRGCRTYVLRGGPRHRRARSNEALRREIRLLSALSGTDVPHPRLVAACGDETVLAGSVFYLMEQVDGFNPTVELPEPYASDPALRHQVGLAVVDALTWLGKVDHVVLGLADFGRTDGFLTRQVPRWLRELDSYRHLANYPGPRIPGVGRVADWLERNMPTRWLPGILHGDYHLANVLCDRHSARVASIVDWEMCTIGDPLLDLGWLLATWPDTSPEPAPGTGMGWGGLALAGGLPSQRELVARYAANSERDLSAIDWYTVLACFKLGILLEGTHARACAGLASRTIGDRLHAAALDLFGQADRRIAGT